MILNEKEIIHLEGYVFVDDDGIELTDEKHKFGSILAEDIARELEKIYHKHGLDSKNSLRFNSEEDCQGFGCISERVPKVFLKIYVSNNRVILEQAKSNILLQQLGCLDIYGEDYGYSEFTIIGLEVENFTLESEDGGSHDIEEILSSYEDKYVHIEMEIIEI